jgi:hypothetical protein
VTIATDDGAQTQLLASYIDRSGACREVVTHTGAAASRLVVDRDALTLGDRRLVAHLDSDEPSENAELMCADYLQRVRKETFRCRPLQPRDFDASENLQPCEPADQTPAATTLRVGDEEDGVSFQLRVARARGALAQLRWWRRDTSGPARPVSLRDAIATLESYEPLRSVTASALAQPQPRRAISKAVLRAELKRVHESPIVLNRGLREAVLAKVEHGDLSMSEIAIRCGRTKRDPNGNVSGETSWLARRLGLLPEGGKSRPTPWIHSDVLALIARSGISIAPREVEL